MYTYTSTEIHACIHTYIPTYMHARDRDVEIHIHTVIVRTGGPTSVRKTDIPHLGLGVVRDDLVHVNCRSRPSVAMCTLLPRAPTEWEVTHIGSGKQGTASGGRFPKPSVSLQRPDLSTR